MARQRSSMLSVQFRIGIPLPQKVGSGNTRSTPDKTTAKLAALHFYQLSIPAPKAPAGSFGRDCIRTGEDGLQRLGEVRNVSRAAALFGIQATICMRPARSASMHSSQANSPTHMCTSPLAGLWTHQKGGFFHDGRFATLLSVVNHYDTQFNLNLSDANKSDLVEYLKGI